MNNKYLVKLRKCWPTCCSSRRRSEGWWRLPSSKTQQQLQSSPPSSGRCLQSRKQKRTTTPHSPEHCAINFIQQSHPNVISLAVLAIISINYYYTILISIHLASLIFLSILLCRDTNAIVSCETFTFIFTFKCYLYLFLVNFFEAIYLTLFIFTDTFYDFFLPY